MRARPILARTGDLSFSAIRSAHLRNDSRGRDFSLYKRAVNVFHSRQCRSLSGVMSNDRHEWFLNQVFRHRAMLQGYLRRYLNSAEDIEDVIQDTYLRIYGIRDYTAVESPKALLVTIAHNLAVELGRRRVARATDATEDLDALGVSSNSPQQEQQLDARRRFEAFCAAVDGLPPICRRVFVLRKVYKLSQAEISAVLGISQSTVEKHVAKGLVRCRDYLREYDLTGKATPSPHDLREEGGAR
jgi:RNA polymerase sigma-70 factor (ECF subfamily)